MSDTFPLNSLVKDHYRIFKVIGLSSNTSEDYQVELLSFIGDSNSSVSMDPVEYDRKHFIHKEKISSFEGTVPKFTYGQYVKSEKINNYSNGLSRVMMVTYANRGYIYFVQEEASSNMYEGSKIWIEEKYLRVS